VDEIVQLRSTLVQTFYKVGPGAHASSEDKKTGAEPRDGGWTEDGIGCIPKERGSSKGRYKCEKEEEEFEFSEFGGC
jgi:hypothetical protein